MNALRALPLALALLLLPAAAAHASFETDISASPNPLVFNDSTAETESKTVTVANNGSAARYVEIESSSPRFQARHDCYTIEPGQSCDVQITFGRTYEESEERGKLVVSDATGQDATTEEVDLIGRSDTRVPSCQVNVAPRQVLLKDGERKPFKILIEQDFPGEIGVFSRYGPHNNTLEAFKGEGDRDASAHVAYTRKLRLKRLYERSIIHDLKLGMPRTYHLLVYCRRASPLDVSRRLEYRITFVDDDVEKKGFQAPLIVKTKFRSAESLPN